MRTTLEIDDDVYRAAKSKARAEERSLGAVLSELARRALRPEPAIRDEEGLPVFDVPADAPLLTSEMVRSALDEEP